MEGIAVDNAVLRLSIASRDIRDPNVELSEIARTVNFGLIIISLHPKNFGEPKTSKIGAISDNFRFSSRISLKQTKISTSGKHRYPLQSLDPRLMEKIW